jgi:uncharacterized protein
MMRRYRWLLLLLVSLLLSLAAGGTLQAAAPDQTVSVLASGEAHAPPDLALVTGGVDVSAATPRAALQAASMQLAGVVAALHQLGIADADLQTTGLSVFPLYGKPDQAGPAPDVTGYRAVNTLTITVHDLAQVDAVVDALVQGGGSVLQGVQFGLSDPAALEQQALADAVRRAQPLAAAAAQAAGRSVGAVLAIEQAGGSTPLPVGVGKGGSGAVQGGTLTVQVQVTVTFALLSPTVTVQLASVAGAGVSGQATLTSTAGDTQVTLDVAGLTPGQPYTSQLHAGNCAQPSASFTDLPQLAADAVGHATASGAVRFRGLEAIALSDLADGNHVIVIALAGQSVACGTIPAG